MTYLLAWLCLSLQLTTSFWRKVDARPTERHEKPPVCIIGAGPAGLTAASDLEAKGIKAVIYDKQSDAGGKCQAWYDEQGIFHPLGAAFFSNATWPETLKVINASGVLAEPFALTLAGARQQFLFNYSTGAIEPAPALTDQLRALLQAEIPRYVQLWQTAFAPYSAVSFKKGVPNELTVSGVEWFHANGFTALPILLVNPLALYGYGDINTVPAYITPDVLTAFIGQHSGYYIDFHKVFVEFVKKSLCKTPLKLNHEIRCVDRSGKNPVLSYTKPHGNFNKWEQQECSSVIFAFPPTIDNLERAGVDITEEENAVFSEVVINNYFSSAVKLELPYGVSYIAKSANPTVPPPNDGEPVAVIRLSQRSNVSTAWSWGPDGEYESESSARDLLQTTLSKINKDPRDMAAQAQPLCSADIRAFRKWDYFPHFGTDPLRNGVYAKLNALQGCKKSYWASGLNGMETVEWAIRAGKDVVASNF